MLVNAVPEPRIHLEMAGDLPVTDPLRAQTVLRCVQEIVTNAVRHAHAANLWIEISQSDRGLRILATDDGRGAKEIRLGHGLVGMRERLEAVGGRLDITADVMRGFTVRAWIPFSDGASA
jgi:signal transduction histidine kinase